MVIDGADVRTGSGDMMRISMRSPNEDELIAFRRLNG